MNTDNSSGTLQVPRARKEVGDRHFQQARQPLQFDVLAGFRLVQRRFVVVVQQRFVISARARRHRRRQQPLGQHDIGAQTRSVRGMVALADALEADARRNHPGVRRRPVQVFAEVLEDRRVLRWRGNEIVERLVGARRQARVGDVVAENPSIDDLSKERGLREQLFQKMRNVLVTDGHEGLVIPRAAAERDDHRLAISLRLSSPRVRRQERPCRGTHPWPRE